MSYFIPAEPSADELAAFAELAGKSGSSGSALDTTTDKAAPQDCRCSCGCAQGSGMSQKPVRYFNGELRLTVDDLPSGGFGMPWGHQRTYSNRLSSNTDYGNGYNWLVDQWSHIAEAGDGSVEVIFNPLVSYWFDLVDGQYVARYGAKQTLANVGDGLLLTFPDGELWLYRLLGDSTAPGKLAAAYSVGANVMSLAYNPDGSVSQASRSASSTWQQYTYTYGTSGASAGRLTTALLTLGSTNVTQVNFTYYDGGSFGNLGDLQTVQTQSWDVATSSWVTIGTTLYRYYKGSDGGKGFQHGLKYVLQPANYQAMVVASLDPLTVSDDTLATYADFYFEYNNTTDRRVSLEAVDGGSQTFTFTYADGPSFEDYNDWNRKAVEISPDGSQRIVYTNFIGQVLLFELNDGAVDTTNRWIDVYEYDSNAHEIFHYTPSAVNMAASPVYDDSYPDLAVALNTGTGLVHFKTYYSYTDPITDGGTGTGSGAVAGYLENEYVNQGTGVASWALLKLLQYTSNATPYATTYPVTATTIYRDAAGTEPIVTTNIYTWFSGTSQPSQIVTTNPLVSTAQNGPNATTTRTELFDAYGNRIWEMDERGFINYQAFDVTLGVVTQSILDFNTSGGGGPPGWTTPEGGGLNLTSDFLYDIQGRRTQSLGPVHTVDLSGTATAIRTASWTVYQDALDQVWNGQGYQTTDETPVVTLVNPVAITQYDDGGRTTGQIAVPRASTSGPLLPTDSLTQPNYVRWSTSIYNLENQLAATRLYFNIPSSGTGTSGTNYNETLYGYDAMDRGNRTQTPSGTIIRTVYDVRDQVTATWVGTDDTGASDNNPSNSGTPPNNMLVVRENQYDGGSAGGDGLLTQATDWLDTTNSRVMAMGYDWRDRQTSVVGAESYCILRTFDNLDRVCKINRMDTSVSGTMLTQATTSFDDMGRVYQTAVYEVTSGIASNPQTSNTWYDYAGNVIKNQPAGSSGWTKMTYDGVGRTIASYIGYSTGTVNYAEASVITNSVIFEQTLTTFDPANNAVRIDSYQRYHDASTGATGALAGPWESDPTARATFLAIYPDGIGRTANTVDYGTNGNAAFSPSPTCPTRPADQLITTNVYNPSGDLERILDPQCLGTVTYQVFDQAGRRTQLVLNYVSGGTHADQNLTTNWTYNPDSNMLTMTVVNADTGDQTTSYAYGITVGGGSTLNSNSPLHTVTYPDSGVVTVEYNRQGDTTQRTDQSGTIRQFGFDGLGRPTTDSVTTPGSGIDTGVLQIAVTYEIRGMVEHITSYNAATEGTVVNDVLKVYNGFRQLITEYQEHSGAVETSSSANVQYLYADGSDNTIRLRGIVYPNGTTLTLSYGTTGGTNDLLSRVESLTWPIAGTPGAVAEYAYLGLGTPVQVEYPEPAVQYNLAVASGADHYTGLDDFGRVIANLWQNVSGAPVDMVRLNYGYDQASNRLWRQDAVAGSANFDELYTNDGLYRLKEMQRGRLNDDMDGLNPGTLDFKQTWRLDPTGNWYKFKEFDDGSTLSLDQKRTSNAVNEITAFTTPTGPAWQLPGYDDTGNMTTIPQPNALTDGYAGKFDAWNRLMKLVDDTTSDTVQENRYDGRNFRVQRLTYTDDSVSETRDFYQSQSWQVLQEYVAGYVDRQYVWGLRYIDDLILRDRSVASPGALDERLYALQDANWNVVALSDTSGTVQERFAYTAYGIVIPLNPDFSDYTGSDYDWTVLYTGRELDILTGLCYYRRRYYHPALGVFLGRDPIEYESGENLNAYVDSSPATYTDPNGEAKSRWTADTSYELVPQLVSAHPGHWGNFSVSTRWIVTPPPIKPAPVRKLPATNWIIQHVKATFDITDATTGMDVTIADDDGKWDYWEAWQVPLGAARPSTRVVATAVSDFFQIVSGQKNTCGTITITGSSQFYPNTILPHDFAANNPNTHAHILRSTINAIALKGLQPRSFPPVVHTVVATWTKKRSNGLTVLENIFSLAPPEETDSPNV